MSIQGSGRFRELGVQWSVDFKNGLLHISISSECELELFNKSLSSNLDEQDDEYKLCCVTVK